MLAVASHRVEAGAAQQSSYIVGQGRIDARHIDHLAAVDDSQSGSTFVFKAGDSHRWIRPISPIEAISQERGKAAFEDGVRIGFDDLAVGNDETFELPRGDAAQVGPRRIAVAQQGESRRPTRTEPGRYSH